MVSAAAESLYCSLGIRSELHCNNCSKCFLLLHSSENLFVFIFEVMQLLAIETDIWQAWLTIETIKIYTLSWHRVVTRKECIWKENDGLYVKEYRVGAR